MLTVSVTIVEHSFLPRVPRSMVLQEPDHSLTVIRSLELVCSFVPLMFTVQTTAVARNVRWSEDAVWSVTLIAIVR